MMNNNHTITKTLQKEFTSLSAQFRTISRTHLQDLHTELLSWKDHGLITKEFYEQNYGSFLFNPSDTLPQAHSIIIIGIPQKIILLEFIHKEKQYHTVLPPTYQYTKLRARCNDILSKVFTKYGYHVDRAQLPVKLLAVRSGLGQYGKNNLCYVEGMGSFTRLEAFYTDYEFPIDNWSEKKLMKACNNCHLCRNACPTQAIPNNRILINADHCLTYLNENEGELPNWVPEHAHNAVVGCMFCQTICPQNKKFLTPEKNMIHFTEKETTALLNGTPREQISQSLAEKLTKLDLDEYYPLLKRNILALIQTKRFNSTS
jgi:epoxyqueuosine reductase